MLYETWYDRMRERGLQDYLPTRREDIGREDVDIELAAVWTSPVLDPSGGVQLFNIDAGEVNVAWSADQPIFVAGDCFGDVSRVYLLIPKMEPQEERWAAIFSKLGFIDVDTN